MRISPRDAWVLSRLLNNRLPVAPGGVEPVLATDRVEPLADLLHATDLDKRVAVWKGFLAGRKDRDDWAVPVAEADPAAAPPKAGEVVVSRPANLEDVKRMFASTPWPWPGWLAGGSLNAMAADPGVGKTILSMNLARVLWTGQPWPDGQPNLMPPRTKTLWIPGDRHFHQLIGLAESYGLPGDAMVLNAPVESPTIGMELDDPGTLDDLEARIRETAPGLVIVDTVGMTTDKNLGRPEEAKAYFSPLMEIASENKVAFLMVTHLSREAQALGRRIVGASRVVWKLTRPDPDGQPNRRKLWVDKSYALLPKPLGMTIAEDGCTFDENPPQEAGAKVGRPPKQRDECKRWLEERLADGPVPGKQVRQEARDRGFLGPTYYDAKKELEVIEVTSKGQRCLALASAQEVARTGSLL